MEKRRGKDRIGKEKRGEEMKGKERRIQTSLGPDQGDEVLREEVKTN